METKAFDILLGIYKSVLNDLEFGADIPENKLDEMWMLMHILHFTQFDYESSIEAFKILDYYEY